MNKLRTLKDMVKFAQVGKYDAEEIKKESIRWIKHYRELAGKQKVGSVVFNMAGHRINFIMEFFNITDQELHTLEVKKNENK